jgi:hypothetical protein
MVMIAFVLLLCCLRVMREIAVCQFRNKRICIYLYLIARWIDRRNAGTRFASKLTCAPVTSFRSVKMLLVSFNSSWSLKPSLES